jgi:hypothetical protein
VGTRNLNSRRLIDSSPMRLSVPLSAPAISGKRQVHPPEQIEETLPLLSELYREARNSSIVRSWNAPDHVNSPECYCHKAYHPPGLVDSVADTRNKKPGRIEQ